jgi:cytochrome c55X
MPPLSAWLTAGALVLGALAPAASAGAPSPERQAALINMLRHDCGACHGLTLKGGLGPPLLAQRLGAVSDRALVAIILDGVPGTPMPPWRPMISAPEAAWLVARLKRGL